MDKNESGKCQCGKISYIFNKEKVISAHHCHCKDCQRATGCGKATIIILAKKNIEVEGELKYYESVGTAGSHIRRGFCAECGSGVLSYAKEVPHIIYLKAGTLDDSNWIKIDSNFFTNSAEEWNKPDETIKSFEKNPGLMSGIKTLLKSF